ncbi:MAG: ABC-2 family transporter protein [Clostridia bacterium]|nr:ABC-2 family transporter protein [Clostridia bacterium]
MKRLTDGVRLYMHYVSLNLRSAMQHKTSFFLQIAGQLLTSMTTFLGITFMFMRFKQVGGYTYSDMLVCFSVVMLQFSLAEMFARGFDTFPSMVRKGEFDRVLVRPRGAVLQVLGARFELTRIGRLLQALIIFVYGVSASHVEWTALRILTLVSMLLGGTLLFAGLYLVYAAFCFFTLEGLEFMNIFTDGAREYGKYPVDVYGEKMKKFATFVIPYALVQYYPLQLLIGCSDCWQYALYPLGAAPFLAACYGFWRFGVRHYTSSGS